MASGPSTEDEADGCFDDAEVVRIVVSGIGEALAVSPVLLDDLGQSHGMDGSGGLGTDVPDLAAVTVEEFEAVCRDGFDDPLPRRVSVVIGSTGRSLDDFCCSGTDFPCENDEVSY